MRLTKIKLARLSRNQRQFEVAARAGLNQSRLSWIENGHDSPRPDELERIARALGVDLADLREDVPAAGCA
jgi:transcriptional regulator with XRE-family HTH domain